MKRILAMGLATVFVVPVLLGAVVFAHEDDSSNEVLQSTTTTEDKEQREETNTESTLEKRLEARKERLKIRLDFTKKLRIQNRCKASQGLIGRIKNRVKGIETSRTQVYGNLVDRLEKLATRLKDAGVDTAQLETEITNLKTKIETFKTDLETYKLVVSDLVELDCKTDPEGFQVSLEDARTALAKVKEDAQAVRTHLTDTIKPLLKELKAQFADKKQDDNQETN